MKKLNCMFKGSDEDKYKSAINDMGNQNCVDDI